MRRLLLAAVLVLPPTAEAQSIDNGTFSIRRAGREIGREELMIEEGRRGVPGGSTVTSRVRIPAVAPTFIQESVIERRADGSFANMVINSATGSVSTRIIAEVARHALRIHTAAGGTERIRELPAAANLLGLADSAFALYALAADLATAEPLEVTGVYPAAARRVSFTARRVSDPAQGTRIILAGEIAGTIWLDSEGHLQRIALPDAGLEIIRLRR